MVESKTVWKGVDDGQITPPVLPGDDPDYGIALPKQKIRSFNIEFVPLKKPG